MQSHSDPSSTSSPLGGDQVHESVLRAWVMQLYKEFDDICFQHRVKLPPPIIRIEPLATGLGSYHVDLNMITIALRLIKEWDWSVVREILKHEMAHQLVHASHSGVDPHGAAFHEACERLGVEHWARRAGVSLTPEMIRTQAKSTADPVQQVTLRRVEKLLALANSSNEHEALLAMQKVRELYERNHLEQLVRNIDRTYTYAIITHRKMRIEPYQAQIAAILGKYFFVRVIYNSIFDAAALKEHKVIEIFGAPHHVQMAEYVYWFLHNNMSLFWREYQSKSHVSGLRVRNNYFRGVLSGFDEKLASMQVATESSPADYNIISAKDRRALLRLEDRKLEVFARQRHPRLRSVYRRESGGHEQTYEEGKKMGRALNLHHGVGAASTASTSRGLFLGEGRSR